MAHRANYQLLLIPASPARDQFQVRHANETARRPGVISEKLWAIHPSHLGMVVAIVVLFDYVGVMWCVVVFGASGSFRVFQEPLMVDASPSGKAFLFHRQILINLIMDLINRT